MGRRQRVLVEDMEETAMFVVRRETIAGDIVLVATCSKR